MLPISTPDVLSDLSPGFNELAPNEALADLNPVQIVSSLDRDANFPDHAIFSFRQHPPAQAPVQEKQTGDEQGSTTPSEVTQLVMTPLSSSATCALKSSNQESVPTLYKQAVSQVTLKTKIA